MIKIRAILASSLNTLFVYFWKFLRIATLPILLSSVLALLMYVIILQKDNEFLKDQAKSYLELYEVALEDNVKLSIENYELHKNCAEDSEDKNFSDEDFLPPEESFTIRKPGLQLIEFIPN